MSRLLIRRLGMSSIPSGSWRVYRGGKGWSREARRQLEQRRWRDPDPVLRSRDGRLLLAAQRLEAERDAVIAGNQAYEQYRAGGRDKTGRRFGRPPNPWVAPDLPEGVVSVSDPDSQRIKANLGYVQGYNAQAVVDESQIVLAAEITNNPADFSQLDPMISAVVGELDGRVSPNTRRSRSQTRGTGMSSTSTR